MSTNFNSDIKAKRHTPQSRSQVISPNVLGEGYPVPVINCEVTQWSKWGVCDPNNGTCGRGDQTKSRHIVVSVDVKIKIKMIHCICNSQGVFL